MKFTPKTKEEFNNERLIPAKTVCQAEVASAEEKVSKTSGNPMIAISLKVYHGANSVFVNDWLVAGSSKLLNFCDVAGLSDAYMAGEVTADLVNGRTVTVKVGVDEAKDGYPARNKVLDYVIPKPSQKPAAAAGNGGSVKGLGVPESQRRNAQAVKAVKAAAGAPADDDVPF